MTVRILIGDVREQLKTLADESVHTVVTSPPYFGLRDYGVEGQIGLEATPQAFVEVMVEVFREVRRVLRADGTLWLNLGDSYAGSWGAQSRGSFTAGTLEGSSDKDVCLSARQILAHPKGTKMGSLKNTPGLKPKDLIGVPWRVAFALQEDGWYLRQDIIWSKPNPMPESVTDRCTKAHEYVFLLAKSGKATIWRARDTGEWSNTPDLCERLPDPTEDDPLATVGRWMGRDYYFDGEAIAEKATGQAAGNKEGYRVDGEREGENANLGGSLHKIGARETRNKRSVWAVPSQPFKEAHFATFPPALIEPCILAGSARGGLVLDPFGGAGTTGLVADRLGRDALLIELNPEYAALARKRIDGDSPLFSPVAA